jgi:hypothetical protein
MKKQPLIARSGRRRKHFWNRTKFKTTARSENSAGRDNAREGDRIRRRAVAVAEIPIHA